MSESSLLSDVRVGRSVTDEDFDRIYPAWVRRASDMHWTPYEVARRAAELLVIDARTRVLDVGAGAGKLCLIGALTTQGTFVGVEQRPGLVEAARQAAQRCEATRAHFILGDITSVDWRGFDAFYFYNPFYEHVADAIPEIEEPIARSPELYTRHVTTTSVKLSCAPVGTRVVTYQGYGAGMPEGYRRLVRELIDGHELALWRKEPLAAVRERARDRRSDATVDDTT